MRMENQCQMSQTAPRGCGCNHGTTTLFAVHVMWDVHRLQCHEPILLIKLLPSILAFVSTGIVARVLAEPAAAMAMPAQPSSLLPVHPWSKDPDTSPKFIPLPQGTPHHVQDPRTSLAPPGHPCSLSLWLQADRQWRSSMALGGSIMSVKHLSPFCHLLLSRQLCLGGILLPIHFPSSLPIAELLSSMLVKSGDWI